MNITVPMNAKKSNRSWVPSGVRPSRRSQVRTLNRVSNFSYGASILLFVVMVSALAAELLGGISPDASAQRGRDYGERSFYYSQRGSNSSNSNTSNSSRVTQPSTTPTQPQPTTTVAPATPVPAVQQAPAPVASAPVKPAARQVVEEPMAPVVADTAPAINEMTSALAVQETAPVTYTTQRISESTRDRLISVSVAAITAGIAMYLLTFIGRGASSMASFAASMPRYKIRVREG